MFSTARKVPLCVEDLAFPATPMMPAAAAQQQAPIWPMTCSLCTTNYAPTHLRWPRSLLLCSSINATSKVRCDGRCILVHFTHKSS